jgi:hypothetical protein
LERPAKPGRQLFFLNFRVYRLTSENVRRRKKEEEKEEDPGPTVWRGLQNPADHCFF